MLGVMKSLNDYRPFAINSGPKDTLAQRHGFTPPFDKLVSCKFFTDPKWESLRNTVWSQKYVPSQGPASAGAALPTDTATVGDAKRPRYASLVNTIAEAEPHAPDVAFVELGRHLSFAAATVDTHMMTSLVKVCGPLQCPMIFLGSSVMVESVLRLIKTGQAEAGGQAPPPWRHPSSLTQRHRSHRSRRKSLPSRVLVPCPGGCTRHSMLTCQDLHPTATSGQPRSATSCLGASCLVLSDRVVHSPGLHDAQSIIGSNHWNVTPP